MANQPGYPRTPEGSAKGGDMLQRALFALNAQRPDEAERIARHVLQADPRQAQALHIFGCALLMQGRAGDAIAPLEAAARGRHDPNIETQLAVALRQAGRQEEALAQLKRATKRRPPCAAAFQELGYLLVSMERYDEAIEAIERGLEIAPMMVQLSVQLGYAFFSRGDYDKAQAAFARALDISPTSPDALFGMGKAHREIGQNAAAADYFRRYLMTTPNDDGGWLNLGWCLLELGDLDAGYECFRSAARGDPRRYGNALASLVKSGHGRFWLKPSAAAQFFSGRSGAKD